MYVVCISSGIQRLYTVSYMWYSGIGVCTVVVVGLIVSFITGMCSINSSMFLKIELFLKESSVAIK